MDQPEDDKTRAINPLIGTKLAGQYTILGIIGEGGMGMIYHARQDIVDREVAIKILPPTLAHDDVNVQRLAREAKALGRLSHANIVTTYDYGQTEKNEPYIVFEFVNGENLQTYLARRGPLPFREAVPLFVQIADAMKYAHANGIVHRDLKPQNIMVVENDGKSSIKVLDFGIAQNKNDSQRLTRAGEIWGSPNYMSPEQCTGDPVDHLSDIYSFGVLMFRTLSGQLPFSGKSFAETVSKKLNEPVPFFGSLDLPEGILIPDYLEEIVVKCLRRYPDERYQSMADVKMSLLAFAKGENIEEGVADIFSGEGTGSKTIALTKPKLQTTSKTRVERATAAHSTDKISGKTSGVTSIQTTGVRKANLTGAVSQTKVKAAAGGIDWTKFKPFVLPILAFTIVCVAVVAILMAGIEIDRNYIRPATTQSPQKLSAPDTKNAVAPQAVQIAVPVQKDGPPSAPVPVPASASAPSPAPVPKLVPPLEGAPVSQVAPADSITAPSALPVQKKGLPRQNQQASSETSRHKRPSVKKARHELEAHHAARHDADSANASGDSVVIHHYARDREGNGFYEQFGGAGGH